MEFISSSAKETEIIGKKIASTLTGGSILFLFGELGAGKTTLVKGIAEGLGVREKVTSPTFTLMKIYPGNTSTQQNMNTSTPEHINTLIHIDTYRLKDERELLAIGVEDYLGKPDTICVIEWPEKIAGLLEGKKVKKIFLEHEGEDKRKIILED